jgi:hypothetical protein
MFTQEALAIATVGTLVVLIKYAIDTNRIAKNSSEQIESSQKPIIALVEREPGHSSRRAIKNLGKGPALNIRYSRHQADDKPAQLQSIAPLAPMEPYSVENADVDFAEKDGFIVEYESLSGRKYSTIVRQVDGAKMHFFGGPEGLLDKGSYSRPFPPSPPRNSR